MNADDKVKNKRQSFRLKYQINDRPRIKLIPKKYGPQENKGVFSYEVVDISERGIRFLYTGGMVENPVNGTSNPIRISSACADRAPDSSTIAATVNTAASMVAFSRSFFIIVFSYV